MSGLGDFEQKKFVAGRNTGKLAAALEWLKTMPMPEKKKIAIVGSGSVSFAMANVCRERGLEPIVISMDWNDARGKAMIMDLGDFDFPKPEPFSLVGIPEDRQRDARYDYGFRA